MIKQSFYTVLAAIGMAASVSACKDLKPNDGLIEEMKDSMSVLVPRPCYKQVRIDDHQDVTIIVGSKSLFNKAEEEQKEIVAELAKMTVHYFEANNYLDDGKVIFVPNETTIPADDDPKKEYDMDLKSLLKK